MRISRTAAALACCALLAGCRQPGFAPQAHSAPIAIPPVTLAVTPDSYLGVYEKSSPISYSLISHFAAMTGRQPKIVLYYSSWHEVFRRAFAEKAYVQGAVPLIQLEPYGVGMRSIAAGASDAYLRSYADAVRAYRHPVIIGFAHEMNGPWYRWGWHRTSPAAWVAAWKHVVDVFRGQGATNVTWLWTINRNAAHTGPIRDWWPGNDYVTWVGLDGYYFQPSDSFTNTFGGTVKDIRKMTGKPILLAETAIGPVAGQAAKIPDLFVGVKRYHLLGLVWFDVNQHRGPYHQDWRLEGKRTAITAFRAAVAAMAS